MRHLRYFKESKKYIPIELTPEQLEEIGKYQELIEEVKDICIELEDMDFKVKVYGTSTNNTMWVIVTNGYDFDIKYIKDVILRIFEYLKSNGWSSMVETRRDCSKGSTTSELKAGGWSIQFSKEVSD